MNSKLLKSENKKCGNLGVNTTQLTFIFDNKSYVYLNIKLLEFINRMYIIRCKQNQLFTNKREEANFKSPINLNCVIALLLHIYLFQVG